LPRASTTWFRAASALVTSGVRLGHLDRIAAFARDLVTMPLDRRASGPPVVARARTALQLLFAGRYDLAERLFAQLDALDPETLRADPSAAARVHQAAALRAHLAGDIAEQLRLHELSAEGFALAGDLRGACAARVNAGFGYVELGANAEAERALLETLAASERMGLVSIGAAARQNLGLCMARLGRLVEARAHANAAIAGFHEQGVARMEGAARVYLADVQRIAGELDAAEREARAAVDMLVVAPPLRPCALATLGRILLDARDVEGALVAARQALAAMDALRGVEEGESIVRLAHAESLRASGDVDGSRRAIAQARDRILERAAKIGDRWRQSFLVNVPENARTLALAKEWGAEA
jgi:hypothetical protein